MPLKVFDPDPTRFLDSSQMCDRTTFRNVYPLRLGSLTLLIAFICYQQHLSLVEMARSRSSPMNQVGKKNSASATKPQRSTSSKCARNFDKLSKSNGLDSLKEGTPNGTATKDCKHYCVPGTLNIVNQLMYNQLQAIMVGHKPRPAI